MQVDSDGVVLPDGFIRTPFNFDRGRASAEFGLACADVTRAQQNFLEETDINTIVRRFGLTGELPTDVAVPQSGDFTSVVDYQTALNMVIAADAAFMEMPADVRKRFNNDPQRFLEFVHDDSNRDEARKLGLLVPPPAAPEPISVRVIPDAPKAP